MVMKAWTGAALEPSSVNDLPERRTRLIAEVLRVERLADQLLISIDELDLKLLPATRASISGAAFVGIASESEDRITATRERKRSVVQRLNALLEKLIPGVITQLNSPALPGGSCGASRAVSSQELFSSEGVGEIRDRKPVESPQRFPVRAPQGNESVEELALLVGGEESAFQTHIVAHLARLVEHVEADDAAAVKGDDEGCDRASVLLESEHDRLIAFAAEVGGIQLEMGKMEERLTQIMLTIDKLTDAASGTTGTGAGGSAAAVEARAARRGVVFRAESILEGGLREARLATARLCTSLDARRRRHMERASVGLQQELARLHAKWVKGAANGDADLLWSLIAIRDCSGGRQIDRIDPPVELLFWAARDPQPRHRAPVINDWSHDACVEMRLTGAFKVCAEVVRVIASLKCAQLGPAALLQPPPTMLQPNLSVVGSPFDSHHRALVNDSRSWTTEVVYDLVAHAGDGARETLLQLHEALLWEPDLPGYQELVGPLIDDKALPRLLSSQWRVTRIIHKLSMPTAGNSLPSGAVGFLGSVVVADALAAGAEIVNAPPLHHSSESCGSGNYVDSAASAREYKMDVDNDADMCVVCLDKKREGAFLPCAHMCCCMVCGDQIVSLGKGCPLCRKLCPKFIRIYR